MKADRKRLKGEKTDLVSQMQQLYATLESREEQLRDFIRNYEQHRKVSASPLPCHLLSSVPALPAQTTQSSSPLLTKHGPCLESQSTLGGSAVCPN